MAEVMVDGVSGADGESPLQDLRRDLSSSSTNVRIARLHALRERISRNEPSDIGTQEILNLLFATYPYYHDRPSRRAVEQCLQLVATSPSAEPDLSSFITSVEAESHKTSIAASNAFVLEEWCSLLLSSFSKNAGLWEAYGVRIVAAEARVLATCLAEDTRSSVKLSALVLARRGLRDMFRSPEYGEVAVNKVVDTLTAKGPSSVANNAILLGVVAGVSARIQSIRPVFAQRAKDYYAFYIREIIGSKSVLPAAVAEGLHDFFEHFVTAEDLQKEVIPAIEKALLRAPEVVLNDLVSPMVLSLRKDTDLSEILHKNLLKPLLANTKSTNPVIRAGAIRTFSAIASRCYQTDKMDKVADEILTPLKQAKVTVPEQRMLHAQMLEAIVCSKATSTKICSVIGPVAVKEANEAAVASQTAAIAKHLKFLLQGNGAVEKSVADSFVSGVGDKRTPFRRIWALRAAETIWGLDDEQLTSKDAVSFVSPLLSKLADTWTEVQSNPIPASTNGLIAIAYLIAALSLTKLQHVSDEKVRSFIKKMSPATTALTAEPKPSFLLNQRVYNKVTAQDDLVWAARALAAVAKHLPDIEKNPAVADAWSQAFIYIITAQGIPPNARKEATKSLASSYMQKPELIGRCIIHGIWQWCRRLHANDKDAAAISARTGTSGLYLVVNSISPPPTELQVNGTTNGTTDNTIMERQLVDLLVLARSQLIPRLSWIELCLRTGVDPGQLASSQPANCMQQIINTTNDPLNKDWPQIHTAAYSAAAELAFVAPDSLTPVLVEQISEDLDPHLLDSIGATEAAIYRTPEGTAFIDVLATKQSQLPDKTAKDYDTMKWEEELRAQLAQKKGQTKKLTADEQAKVRAQLEKEAGIRRDVAQVESRLRRGTGIIQSLATGPPTEAELWIGMAVDLLIAAIKAGAGLLLGDAAAAAYIACSQVTSSRLGAMRKFVGVAALRATGTSHLPEGLDEESLGDLITRVLYRLRFMGEQRPFDPVTLVYALPLMFAVIEQGGVEKAAGEEADEQIVLALEFLSFHTDICSNARLPRSKLLSALIQALQRYQQHFRITRDCLTDLCRAISSNASSQEIDVIVRGAIVPEISVRTSVLQAINAEMDVTDRDYCEELWLACHDDVEENVELARTIWEENGLEIESEAVSKTLPYLGSKDAQLRRAAARSLAEALDTHKEQFQETFQYLMDTYVDRAKPRAPQRDKYGMPLKVDLADPWEERHGIALSLGQLASMFKPDDLILLMSFLVNNGPLGDRSDTVRNGMIDAATSVVALRGQSKVEELMKLFEEQLEAPDKGSQSADRVNEAVIILYGALARHLKAGDKRVPKVVQRLLATLSTPSETVQYAVAQCLPPLVQASKDDVPGYVQQMLDELLNSKKYASRRGAAYGIAGIVSGKGISALREFRIMSSLKAATENKKDPNQRQGAFLAYELLSLILGRIFEPYVIQIVPQLLTGFGDSSADVREACLDAAKTCFSSLSSYGVKHILPTLLEGLDEDQWRSKKGACDSLGAMAYLDPQQLALSLPDIIPPLTTVLNDSHKEVRASANRALQRFGDVISNPEIKALVNIILKALSDPTKYTDEALDALIKVQFLHYLDAPSLALVVRILERGLGDRSATKRKAAQIIGSLAHLTEKKDLTTHLPILVAGLRVAAVDPVPTTRATASKALGSLVEKLGEDALPDLIPSLMSTLKSDSGAGDRLGSAQALSEVLAGLGTGRLEETLPTILQNVSSSKAAVREGFMSLFIFLPACFGNSFANYLSRIIPPILSGLADDIESIRETALRAGRLLVKNFATRAIDLLLPELERGLADDSYRIRLSSVELVGDLLFNLTGISAKAEQEEVEETANEASKSLLEVLGEERRNKVLSALYICRCDTSGLVRTAAINVWKALVASPRTLKELIPTLTQLLIRRLASSNQEQKLIAGNALGELIRKAGEGVLATLLPTLEEGLQTAVDTDAREGICIALRELITSASPEALEDYEKTLISVVRTALVDPDADVREAAAEAFDSLQRIFGKRAVDQVLPPLLNLLRTEDGAENALSALLTLLNDATRSNIILPNLLPTLLTTPISAFNARALASLAQVAGGAMVRRLPIVLNSLMDNIVSCKDPELKSELETSFDTVLLSVNEYDGLNTAMSVMLALAKHDDHRKRQSADLRLANFFAKAEIDISRYNQDLIRALLISFDDSDGKVVKAAWQALSELIKRLRKEEMESLVISTRQVLQQVGVAGSDLPGFSLPKGINAVLPIFLQGLMNGTPDQRTQAALAISDIIDRTNGESLRPFVTQITGPLIRVVSERSVDVKAAILLTLNNLLEKIPTYLKPFLPQLQRTFAKSLADTSSEVLRIRAAKALGTLITMTPRVDPLIVELVTGSKTPDAGVRNAMLKALYEVVSKAGSNMNEASRNSILGLIDTDTDDSDFSMSITHARLLGALIKVLPEDVAGGLIKSRVLTTHYSKSSVLALNSILAESPESLVVSFPEETQNIIVQGIGNSNPVIADNCVLALGKYLLTPSSPKAFEATKSMLTALAPVIAPGQPIDTRRLALVVVRTVARRENDLIRPHIALLAPPVFASVRDPVIPVKLAAEQAFLTLFSVADEESALFDKYMASPAGQALPPGTKRSMQDYFKRVAIRLGSLARERKEAEGGQGGLGLSSDEVEDEKEVWSVGRVDLGEGTFSDD